MALLSYVVTLPRDLPNPSGPLSSQLVIMEPKSKTCRKRGPFLKLDDGMRANVHICIHRLVVQLQYLVPGEIEKSRMLHPLLPQLKLACLAKITHCTIELLQYNELAYHRVSRLYM